jgi:hypothetical protein
METIYDHDAVFGSKSIMEQGRILEMTKERPAKATGQINIKVVYSHLMS